MTKQEELYNRIKDLISFLDNYEVDIGRSSFIAEVIIRSKIPRNQFTSTLISILVKNNITFSFVDNEILIRVTWNE